MILTGGNTAKILYNYWSKNFLYQKKFYNFYLSHERIYVNKKNNNSTLVKKNFLNYLNKKNYYFNEINIKPKNIKKECKRYSNKIGKIDILLLSIGNDGHIASIFPNSIKKINKTIKVDYCNVINKFKDRITITPKVINNTKIKIILIIGYKKGYALKKSLNKKYSILNTIKGLKKNTFFLMDYLASKGYSS